MFLFLVNSVTRVPRSCRFGRRYAVWIAVAIPLGHSQPERLGCRRCLRRGYSPHRHPAATPLIPAHSHACHDRPQGGQNVHRFIATTPCPATVKCLFLVNSVTRVLASCRVTLDVTVVLPPLDINPQPAGDHAAHHLRLEQPPSPRARPRSALPALPRRSKPHAA